jgi:hypothetical protein
VSDSGRLQPRSAGSSGRSSQGQVTSRGPILKQASSRLTSGSSSNSVGLHGSSRSGSQLTNCHPRSLSLRSHQLHCWLVVLHCSRRQSKPQQQPQQQQQALCKQQPQLTHRWRCGQNGWGLVELRRLVVGLVPAAAAAG